MRFAGRVSDAEVARLLSSCRALVVTAVEEFGIAAVEAQAAGRPVLAMDAGGLVETVIEGVTGRFWDGGPDELAEAVASFDTTAVDPQACVESAARFRLDAFRASLPREVEAAMASADDETRHERRAARASATRTARRGLAAAASLALPPRAPERAQLLALALRRAAQQRLRRQPARERDRLEHVVRAPRPARRARAHHLAPPPREQLEGLAAERAAG